MMKKWMIYIMLVTVLCAVLAACGAEQTATGQQTTSDVTQITDTTQTTGTTEPKILSEEEVKGFALFCAGTTEKRVTNYQCELTYHEERECQVYVISFDVGRVHFQYVFRATDCDIIENTKIIGEQ